MKKLSGAFITLVALFTITIGLLIGVLLGSKGASTFLLVMIGSFALLLLLAISFYFATKYLHHYLLVWKYFHFIKEARGVKDTKVFMHTMEELEEYVRRCHAWHYPEDRVKEALLSVGWGEASIDTVFNRFKAAASDEY